MRREERKETSLRSSEEAAEEYSFDGSSGRLVSEAVPRRRALGLFGGALLGATGLTFLLADPAEARKRGGGGKKKKKKRRRAPDAPGAPGAPVTSTGVTASPTVLDFGEVNLGEINTLPLTITNNGSTPVTIAPDGPLLVGDGFSLVGAGPVTVAPGETKVVEVTFAPTDALLDIGDIVPGAIEIVDVNDEIVKIVPLIGVVGGIL